MLEIVLTGAIVIGLVVHVILISKIENLERRIKTLNAKINLLESKQKDAVSQTRTLRTAISGLSNYVKNRGHENAE